MSEVFKATVTFLRQQASTDGEGPTKDEALSAAYPGFDELSHLEASASVHCARLGEIWHKSPKMDWVRRK